MSIEREPWQSPSGAVASEQRVRVARPAVAVSPEGARALGRAYWEEVERFTRGLVRPRGRNGGVELAAARARRRCSRFGPAEVRIDGDSASSAATRSSAACSPARPAARSPSRSRRAAARAARRRSTASSPASAPARAAELDRGALPHVQQRLHGASAAATSAPDSREGPREGRRPRRDRARSAAALVPVLAGEHDVVAVSRRARRPRSRRRHLARADVTDAASRAPRRSQAPTSSTTSSTRSARPTSSAATRARPRRSRARPRRRACGRSSTSAASATTRPTSRRTCAAASRRARLASGRVPVTTLRAAMVVGARQRRLRDDRRARRPPARR